MRCKQNNEFNNSLATDQQKEVNENLTLFQIKMKNQKSLQHLQLSSLDYNEYLFFSKENQLI